MNAIIEMLLEQVREKMTSKGLSIQAQEVLEDVELSLIAMTTKIWTIEDTEYLNNQMEMMSKKLNSIKKEDKCSTEN